MDSFVVNVVIWILIGPELVLPIDSVEADVWCVALTIWKASNLASTVNGSAIPIYSYKAFVCIKAKDIFAEHTL